ncbi:MAG: helix-turn-helix transcriptional regulator [bacterium]|nr:helix-turn-helix transcriptional regulator [bacterium]
MLKKEVGIRFKAFRLNQSKAQHVLAAELKVHQSTITNIEHGTTFPKISYLFYFYETYGLNINWLITGLGKMYLKDSLEADAAKHVTLPNVGYGNPTYSQYTDLAHLMRVPAIEQVILAKLLECKILFKEEVKEFFDAQEQLELEQAEGNESKPESKSEVEQ